MKLNFEIKT